MDHRSDYSTQLLEIARDFLDGTRLPGIDPQCVPDHLRDRIEDVVKASPTYFSLDEIETVVVAVLLQKTCADSSPGGRGMGVLDLLNSTFSAETPLSNSLRVVKTMCDRDICYARKYQGRPVATAFANFGAGAISDLFFDTISLSERAAAWIVGDDLMRGFFGETPYESNTEFLNDWSQAINHLFISDFEWYGDHPFWNYLFGSVGVRRELDRISRRLAITTVDVPFVDLITEFDLRPPEQLVIMYDLQRGWRDHSWTSLNINFFCEPNESLWFMDRPPMNDSSRLVRCGLMVKQDVAADGGAAEYHLSEKARQEIIGRAGDNNKCPLV